MVPYCRFTYFVARADPIFFTDPSFTIFPSTASTVVGLTSGKNPQISDLDIGNTLFSTVCSILSVFFSFFRLLWKTLHQVPYSTYIEKKENICR